MKQTEIKVDEMFRLMGDIRTKISSNDTMPCRVVFLVEFLLDISSDVLLDVVFLQCLSGTIDGVLFMIKKSRNNIVDTCCMSSLMSAFLITAFRSDILALLFFFRFSQSLLAAPGAVSSPCKLRESQNHNSLSPSSYTRHRGIP